MTDHAARRRASHTAEPDAHGEWWVPATASTRLPTVVLVHGGFWRPAYDRHLEDAVAADLAGRGYLVWNLDYQPALAGWPATLASAATAYDALGTGREAGLVDHSRIAVVGHSAGGQLALWLASRHRLPDGAPGAPDGWLPPALAVGQAPVAALRRAAERGLGNGAVNALCGGPPDVVASRYAGADPVALLPAVCPVVLVHGDADEDVPVDQSEAYLEAADRAGADVRLQRYAGGHDEHLDPASEACRLLRTALESSIGRP